MPSVYEPPRIVGTTLKRLFEAWLGSEEHVNMTGRAASTGSEEGESFKMFGGLITGRILNTKSYHRIVQAWNVEDLGGRVFESRVESPL